MRRKADRYNPIVLAELNKFKVNVAYITVYYKQAVAVRIKIIIVLFV